MKSFDDGGGMAMTASVIKQKKPLITEQSERLILDNMNYVKALAHKLGADFPSVDMDDLIQAGNVGLVEAARRFDQDRSVKFTTYAYSWIRKYMMQECEKTIYKLHVPDKVRRNVRYVKNLRSIYTLFLDREPTFDELVHYLEKEKRFTKKEAEKYLKNVGAGEAAVYSLDRQINEDSNITFADIIEDPYRVEHTLADLLPAEMEKTLSTLTPKERRVLEVRFGIGIGRAYTIEEAAAELKLTPMRIWQIEAKALRKLRHPSRSRRLKSYLE